MVRLLELFSGTHSVGKIAKERGYEVYSVDRDLPNYDKLDKDTVIGWVKSKQMYQNIIIKKIK